MKIMYTSICKEESADKKGWKGIQEFFSYWKLGFSFHRKETFGGISENDVGGFLRTRRINLLGRENMNDCLFSVAID